MDTEGPVLAARAAVIADLARRGWTARDVTDARVRFLDCEAADGRRVRVRIKAKTSGMWQATVGSGSEDPPAYAVPTFWVFVDLGSSPRASFIVPDSWIRRDIYRDHQAYLERNGGHRPANDASQHHGIADERIAQWRDQWQLLSGDTPARADSERAL